MMRLECQRDDSSMISRRNITWVIGIWLANKALKWLFPSKCFLSNLYHYLLGFSTFWQWNSKLFH